MCCRGRAGIRFRARTIVSRVFFTQSRPLACYGQRTISAANRRLSLLSCRGAGNNNRVAHWVSIIPSLTWLLQPALADRLSVSREIPLLSVALAMPPINAYRSGTVPIAPQHDRERRLLLLESAATKNRQQVLAVLKNSVKTTDLCRQDRSDVGSRASRPPRKSSSVF